MPSITTFLNFLIRCHTKVLLYWLQVKLQPDCKNLGSGLPSLMAADKPCPQLQPSLLLSRSTAQDSLHLRSSNLSHLITSQNIQQRTNLCKYFKVQTQNIQSLQSHNSSLIMESASKNSINGFNKISYLPQVDFIFF